MNETIPAFRASVYHHLLGIGWLALKTRYVIGQWMKKKKAKTNLNLVMKEEKVSVLQFGRCMFLFQELSAHFLNSQLRIDEIKWFIISYCQIRWFENIFSRINKRNIEIKTTSGTILYKILSDIIFEKFHIIALIAVWYESQYMWNCEHKKD